ncbi:MAG TPA: cytochrome C oxidase subunit IV family protein [Gemmataceae bacterium]|nr:cytochrome C oxidase subunit IV family protein [Gemmataceae bacterium]
MTHPHHPDASHAHEGPTVTAYLVVFGALSVFTIVSFIVNGAARSGTITHFTSFLIILGVAVVKAGLVGAYFMHLLLDWKRVGFMIIPAFILATMIMFVLLPDFVLAWRQ